MLRLPDDGRRLPRGLVALHRTVLLRVDVFFMCFLGMDKVWFRQYPGNEQSLMQSQEIIARTLSYRNPQRVARSYDDSDIIGASYEVATQATDWHEVGGGRWERVDEWGNTWARLDPTSKGEVIRGALESLTHIDALDFPDFSNADDYQAVCAMRAAHPDKYLLGHLPGFAFNVARKLRRLDQYMVDLLTEPAAMHHLHDRIDALLADMIRNYAAHGADGVMVCEDWGTQQQLLISPALWHKEFGPRFQRLCSLAHTLGVSVWMHSCGNITAIIPALAEAGVNVFQFDQPELYGLETLAAFQCAARITFWCPVDIQKILPTRSESLIRARARAMLDTLWRGGGFVAGYYPDNASLGLEPKWQDYACDAFTRYGVVHTGSE